jgi:hypothetical protein
LGGLEVSDHLYPLRMCARVAHDAASGALSMPEHPESFPVNALVPIAGTPLENNDVRDLLSCASVLVTDMR